MFPDEEDSDEEGEGDDDEESEEDADGTFVVHFVGFFQSTLFCRVEEEEKMMVRSSSQL